MTKTAAQEPGLEPLHYLGTEGARETEPTAARGHGWTPRGFATADPGRGTEAAPRAGRSRGRAGARPLLSARQQTNLMVPHSPPTAAAGARLPAGGPCVPAPCSLVGCRASSGGSTCPPAAGGGRQLRRTSAREPWDGGSQVTSRCAVCPSVCVSRWPQTRPERDKGGFLHDSSRARGRRDPAPQGPAFPPFLEAHAPGVSVQPTAGAKPPCTDTGGAGQAPWKQLPACQVFTRALSAHPHPHGKVRPLSSLTPEDSEVREAPAARSRDQHKHPTASPRIPRPRLRGRWLSVRLTMRRLLLRRILETPRDPPEPLRVRPRGCPQTRPSQWAAIPKPV